MQCCALTGKAANRIPAEASTIARLSRSEKWKCVNCSGSWRPDIVFVDEVSRVNIELFAELLTMIPLKEIPAITWYQSGELGTRNWNHLLQDRFNPQKEENRFYCGGKEFRLHDRLL